MSFIKNIWQKAKKLFFVLFIAQLVYIILLKLVFPPITLIQFGNWIGGNGLKRDYVAWNDISPELKLAVMASEDQLFAQHNGFDWKSIEKAVKHNQRKPKRVRG